MHTLRVQPLILNADDGTPIVVLFSSPERAKAFIVDFPGFGDGLLTEFTWVLEIVGRDVGIALNPGHVVRFDMEPATVNELVEPSNSVIPKAGIQNADETV